MVFASDEMMNLAGYWRLGPWRLLLGPFVLWKSYYRPVAGWLYMALFHVFGLNPVPVHATALLFLLGTAYLVYRLARVLG